jgi:hypothetical protein
MKWYEIVLLVIMGIGLLLIPYVYLSIGLGL